MPLRILSTLRPPMIGALELAVRRVLGADAEDLEVVITPAMDADHAEVVIHRNGAWRAAYFAPLALGADEHVDRIRDTLRKASTPR